MSCPRFACGRPRATRSRQDGGGCRRRMRSQDNEGLSRPPGPALRFRGAKHGPTSPLQRPKWISRMELLHIAPRCLSLLCLRRNRGSAREQAKHAPSHRIFPRRSAGRPLATMWPTRAESTSGWRVPVSPASWSNAHRHLRIQNAGDSCSRGCIQMIGIVRIDG